MDAPPTFRFARSVLPLAVLLSALAVAAAPALAAPAPPVPGVTVNVAPVKGSVLVRCPPETAFTPLTEARQILLGCEVDARDGTVELTSARADGTPQSGEFRDGLFAIAQEDDVAVLTLSGPLECSGHPRGASAAKKKRRGRRLWGRSKGRFRTVGRRGSASTRGTEWLTEDSCAKTTAFTVTESVVDVRDFVKRKTIAVKAGEKYIAGVRRSSVAGPRVLRIGKRGTIRVRGLASPIAARLQLCPASCRFFTTLAKRVRSDAEGTATIRFRVPTRVCWFFATQLKPCKNQRWPADFRGRGLVVTLIVEGSAGDVPLRRSVRLRY
jgi:hypothetical protein